MFSHQYYFLSQIDIFYQDCFHWCWLTNLSVPPHLIHPDWISSLADFATQFAKITFTFSWRMWFSLIEQSEISSYPLLNGIYKVFFRGHGTPPPIIEITQVTNNEDWMRSPAMHVLYDINSGEKFGRYRSAMKAWGSWQLFHCYWCCPRIVMMRNIL